MNTRGSSNVAAVRGVVTPREKVRLLITYFVNIMSHYTLKRKSTVALSSDIPQQDYAAWARLHSLQKALLHYREDRSFFKMSRFTNVKTDHPRKALPQYRKDESSATKKDKQKKYRESRGKQRRFSELEKTFIHDS